MVDFLCKKKKEYQAVIDIKLPTNQRWLIATDAISVTHTKSKTPHFFTEQGLSAAYIVLCFLRKSTNV